VPFFFKQWGGWVPYAADLDNGIARHVLAVNGAISRGDELRGGPDRRPLWCPIRKVGKAAAGRMLDGIEHNAMPEVRA
jgi:hypothetical protein